MKIAVCIKQVPANDKIEIDMNTHQIIRSNAEMTVNQADMNALTEAIRFKKDCGATVDVYTMGNANAKAALITAIAIGGDEGYLITDRAFAGGDSLATAKVLAKSIQKQGPYDLIICGSFSSDGATGQVGPMIAQLLNISSLTEAKELRYLQASNKIDVSKMWKNKCLHMQMTLPALITVSLGSNTPYLPTLRNQMKARKKEIYEITNRELNLPEDEIGLAGAKSVVTDTILVENTGKKSIFIDGGVEHQAEEIIKLLGKAGE